MNTSNSYESHIAISKELKMNSDFIKVREPYKEDFEKIYSEAKEKGINMDNAKDFLNSLSKEELSTLQQYSGLAEEIDSGTINDEGAYNLLLHHYEKYDFDNDGSVMNGKARTTTLIPADMPDNEKKAYVQTLNEMDEKDAFLASMILNRPKSFRIENGKLIANTNNEPSDFNTIIKDVNRILNPMVGEIRSQEILNVFREFKDLFEKNFEEIENQKNAYTNKEGEVNITKALLTDKGK